MKVMQQHESLKQHLTCSLAIKTLPLSWAAIESGPDEGVWLLSGLETTGGGSQADVTTGVSQAEVSSSQTSANAPTLTAAAATAGTVRSLGSREAATTMAVGGLLGRVTANSTVVRKVSCCCCCCCKAVTRLQHSDVARICTCGE